MNGEAGGIVTVVHSDLTSKIQRDTSRMWPEGMRICFSGAARTVSGSLHILECNQRTFLLDCGMYHGWHEDMYAFNAHMPVSAETVHGVFLSHAHGDHCGRIPRLIRCGYRGPIYATAETIELCALLLYDCAYVMRVQTAQINQKRVAAGRAPVPSLYTEDDVAQALRQMVPVAWDTPYQVASGIDVIFRPAGHILGASYILIRYTTSRATMTVAYSGDIGRHTEWVLPDPAPLMEADHVIVESTYGGSTHRPYAYARSAFRDALSTSLNAGGVVIIPAFSVGRTQRLLHEIYLLKQAHEIPQVPVYLDSPLSVRASDVFCRVVRDTMANVDESVLQGVTAAIPVQTARASRALIHAKKPYIVLTASGMCEAGRVLHHLRHRLPEATSRVIFVGFCAPGTLGRALIEGQKTVRIHRTTVPVAAQIDVFDTFSAHADSDELSAWLAPVAHTARSIFIVHGEERRSFALADRCMRETRAEVIVPFPGETFSLTAKGIDFAA